MTIRRNVAILAAVGACLGCAALDAAQRKSPLPTTLEGEWAIARNASTRRATLYDQAILRATVTATYLSPAVREARARRLQEWLGWTEQELARKLKEEADEAARYDDFVVAFLTLDRKANDLDATESVWRLAVRFENGDEIVTHDAKALDLNVTLTGLFPYVSKFDTAYRVRFNRAPGKPLADQFFTLVIASALGKLELPFGDGTVGPDRPMGTPIP